MRESDRRKKAEAGRSLRAAGRFQKVALGVTSSPPWPQRGLCKSSKAVFWLPISFGFTEGAIFPLQLLRRAKGKC